MTLDALRDAVLAVAPELAQADLQVVRHQPEWPLPPGARAYCLRGDAFHTRPYLERVGKWSGRFGSLIVLAVEPDSDRDLFGMVWHEAAHLVPVIPAEAPGGQPEGEDFEAYQAAFVRSLQRDAVVPHPWLTHELEFIRAAVHLQYRAARLGLPVTLPNMHIAGQFYGTSPATDYAQDLGLEPELCQGMTFAEIDARPMPFAFIERFASDVARWHRARTFQKYAK